MAEKKEVKCSECGKVRTNEPDYTILQPVTGAPLGWYSGDDGEFCPEDIAALMGPPGAYKPWRAEE